MAKEVEKKFKLILNGDELNQILTEVKGKRIEQTYLKLDSSEVQQAIQKNFPEVTAEELGNIKEARFRQKGEGEKAKFFFTLKSGGQMSRDEYEIELDGENLKDIRSLLASEANRNGEVFKTRYEISKSILGKDQPLVVEIDVYDGAIKGLLLAEIEFDPEQFSEEEINRVIKEQIDNDAEDVTESKVFKNKELAKIKSLDELQIKRSQEKEAQQKIPIR